MISNEWLRRLIAQERIRCVLYIHFTVLARGGRRPVNILKKGIGDYENKYKAD